ncbi:hypothetical protein J6590_063811 [Homalodisca vitripennis]|nr:hypothetical protein J6590_063811 [Homalodisca vitripennis]
MTRYQFVVSIIRDITEEWLRMKTPSGTGGGGDAPDNQPAASSSTQTYGIFKLPGKQEKCCAVCSKISLQSGGKMKRSRTACVKCNKGLHGVCLTKHVYVPPQSNSPPGSVLGSDHARECLPVGVGARRRRRRAAAGTRRNRLRDSPTHAPRDTGRRQPLNAWREKTVPPCRSKRRTPSAQPRDQPPARTSLVWHKPGRGRLPWDLDGRGLTHVSPLSLPHMEENEITSSRSPAVGGCQGAVRHAWKNQASGPG